MKSMIRFWVSVIPFRTEYDDKGPLNEHIARSWPSPKSYEVVSIQYLERALATLKMISNVDLAEDDPEMVLMDAKAMKSWAEGALSDLGEL